MKKTFLSFVLLASTMAASGQVTVTVTNPSNASPALAGSYNSLSTAITALSATTAFSGPVMLTCAAGTETAPAGGYAISFTGVSSAANNVVIDGGGSTITTSGGLTAGNITDAIFKIIGSDYVTLQNFVMQENMANTTTAAATNTMTEWGVALLYASTTNGAQNNTIQNNTISLNRTYRNTFGIYSNTRHSATSVTAAAEVTAATGSNSFNKIYGNVISNVNYGIVFIGAGTTLAAIDNGNDIGGSSVLTGNTTTNWGNGGALSAYISLTGNNYCIFNNQQINDNISFNTITSAALTSNVTEGGILKNYSVAQPTSSTVTTINNNKVTVTNSPAAATTGGVVGINNQGITTLLSSATISINNNAIQNCTVGGSTSTTNAITGITNLSLAGTLNIQNNKLSDNAITATSATTGNLIGISNSGASNNINISGNALSGFAVTSSFVAGILSSAGTNVNIYRNNISALSNSNSAGTVYGMIAQTAGTYNIYNNIISDLRAPSSTISNNSSVTGVVLGAVPANLYYNTIALGKSAALTGGTNFTVTGLQYNTAATILKNNIIWMDAIPSGTGTVAAVRRAAAGTAGTAPTSTNFNANNNIYNIQSPGANKYLYVEGVSVGSVRNGYGINIGIADDATNNLKNDVYFNTACGLYKSFMGSGRENGTFNEDNLTASGAPNYTFTPSGTSFAEASAVVITNPSITDDYSGIVRSTMPDMGALEFAGTGTDATPPAISFTNLSTTACLSAPALNVTINDANGVNTSASLKPRLYFRKGGVTAEADAFLNYPAENTSAFNGWKYVEATGTMPNFTFNMDFSLLTNPVADGDSITYFVLAQDMNGNVGKSAVNFPAGFCPASVNLPVAGAEPATAASGYKISSAAASYITIADGEWNNPAIWPCGVVPPTGANNVTIAHNITVSNAGNVGGNTTINSGASLTINAGGELSLGNTGGGKISLNDNGTLQVNGGTLNINGNLAINNGAHFIQSAGLIAVDGNAAGVVANSVSATTPIVGIGSTTSAHTTGTISLTGGTLRIVDPSIGTSTTTSYAMFYNGGAALADNTYATDMHVLEIGDGISTDAGGSTAGFLLNLWESNSAFKPNILRINSANGTNRVVTSRWLPFSVGEIDIVSGELRFISADPASIVSVDKNISVASSGILTNDGILNLGIGTYNPVTFGLDMVPSSFPQAISSAGIIRNAATSPTANLIALTVNNNSSSGVTLNTPLQVSGTLTMTAGIINTTSTNLLTLGTGTSSTTAGTLTYTNGIINGPFKKWIRNATATYRLPIGTSSNLENVSLQFTTAPATGGTITARWSAAAPDFPNAASLNEGTLVVDNVSSMGYWSIDTGNNLTGGTYTATFTCSGAFDVIDYTKAVLLKRPGAGSDWALNGTHVTTTGSNPAPVLRRTGMTGFSQFAIGGEKNVALPVNIVYFKGRKDGKANVLDWKVNGSGVNIMVLERSLDSRKFEAIYTENTDGKAGESSYNYMDIHPDVGPNYYRLSVMEPGGGIKYSNIVLLQNGDKAFELLAVRPNPVIAIGVLVINALKAGNITITVRDVSGKAVLQQNAFLDAGETLLSLDFSKLAAGTYNIHTVNGEGVSKTVRFVKN